MGPENQGPEALIGQAVAGYRLERVLGVGATGAVYFGSLLEDAPKRIERANMPPEAGPSAAAIKLLIVPWQLSATQASDFRARFLREADTLRQLSHPNILPVLDSGQDATTGKLYMVLPYIERTLADRLATAPNGIPLAEAGALLTQLAGALDYAHSQGVVHRDVKPANILLDEHGNVSLADFGILRLLDASRTKLTTTGGVLGTPEYMAPEQARGEPLGPAADRYSLAVVAYEMVTGRTPFAGEMVANILVRQMQEAPTAPHVYREDLPEPAEAVILKGLAKRPEDRFALSSQFAEAFSAGVAGTWSPLAPPIADQAAQPGHREPAPPPQFLPGQAHSAATPAPRTPSSAPDGVPAVLPVQAGARTNPPRATPWPAAGGPGDTTQPDLLMETPPGQFAAGRIMRRQGMFWGTLSAAVALLIIACLLLGVAGSHFGFAFGTARNATATTSHSSGGIAFGSTTTATATHAGASTAPTGRQPTSTSGHPPTKGPTAVPGAPTATPIPGATATPSPTATAIPLVDRASVTNSGNTAQNPGTGFGVTFTATNTGTTTWGAGYALVCEANCYGAGAQSLGGNVGPGQSATFNIGMSAPGAGNILNDNYSASTTTWQMQRTGAPFGNQSSLTVSVHGWTTAYGPMTPCPGSNGWVTIQNSTGCGVLQTTTVYYPEMDLQGWKVNDTGQFRMEAHVNLTTYNAGNYEGDLVINTPQYPGIGGADLGVRANGTWTVWRCCSGNIPVVMQQSSVTPSTSYDLAVVVSGGTIHFYVNGGEVWSTSPGNVGATGNEQGLMQWWNVRSANDYSYWSNVQLANWQ